MVSWGVFCFWAISKMTKLGDMAFLPYPKCHNSVGWCKMSLKQRLRQSKNKNEKKNPFWGILGHFCPILVVLGPFLRVPKSKKIRKFFFDEIDLE